MLSPSLYSQLERPEENVNIAGHIQTLNQQSDHGNTDQADVDMKENDDYGPLEESMVTNPEDTKLQLNSSLIFSSLCLQNPDVEKCLSNLSKKICEVAAMKI